MDKPAASNTSSKKRTMIQLRFVLMPIGIILLAFVVLAVLSSMAPKPAKKPAVTRSPLVEVIDVRQDKVRFEIESQGSITPRTETTLISEVAGVVKQVSEKFVVGGFFEKGELILEIDPINYEVALLQAQAALEGANAKLIEEQARGKQARKDWQQTGRPLSEAPILALRKPQLQQAKASVKAAEADLKNAEIKLANTKIRAPYDAMLKVKMVDVGQYVTTGSQLAKTFAIDYAELRLPIKEQDMAFLELPKIHQQNEHSSPVTLYATQGGKVVTWESKLVRSEGVVDTKSRVDYVVAQIDDPYGIRGTESAADELRIGTFVNAVIKGKSANDIVTIPRAAMRGADRVFALSAENTLMIVTVNVIRADSKNVYAYAPQLNNARVITTNIETAVEGMSLRTDQDTVVDVAESKLAQGGN